MDRGDRYTQAAEYRFPHTRGDGLVQNGKVSGSVRSFPHTRGDGPPGRH